MEGAGTRTIPSDIQYPVTLVNGCKYQILTPERSAVSIRTRSNGRTAVECCSRIAERLYTTGAFGRAVCESSVTAVEHELQHRLCLYIKFAERLVLFALWKRGSHARRHIVVERQIIELTPTIKSVSPHGSKVSTTQTLIFEMEQNVRPGGVDGVLDIS